MAPGNRKSFTVVGSTEDYEETRRLGSGNYGTVVMARHRLTGEEVAIKRVGESASDQYALMRERIFLEACRGNPHVVEFHGVVYAPGSMELRLVMECAGRSLRDLFLNRQDRGHRAEIPESIVRNVMRQLLTGVEKMHALGIVHRDIKPDNILVSAQNIVKICDLGLALDTSGDVKPYGLAGSWWYMAPEVLMGKPDYDARVDVWSLGCVMTELVAGGRVLFQASNGLGQLCAIIDVLGVPDCRTWPWLYQATMFATELLPLMLYANWRNRLREQFPETVLSAQGFEVLSGLLTWDPDRRLTASSALRHPWFANARAVPVQAMARKVEWASALPKEAGNNVVA